MPQNAASVSARRAPRPCFDTLETLDQWRAPAELDASQARDFAIAVKFLRNYVGSQGTFNAYRREVERLLQWTWYIALMTLGDLKREDIEAVHGELPVTRRLRSAVLLECTFVGRKSGFQQGRSLFLR